MQDPTLFFVLFCDNTIPSNLRIIGLLIQALACGWLRIVLLPPLFCIIPLISNDDFLVIHFTKLLATWACWRALMTVYTKQRSFSPEDLAKLGLFAGFGDYIFTLNPYHLFFVIVANPLLQKLKTTCAVTHKPSNANFPSLCILIFALVFVPMFGMYLCMCMLHDFITACHPVARKEIALGGIGITLSYCAFYFWLAPNVWCKLSVLAVAGDVVREIILLWGTPRHKLYLKWVLQLLRQPTATEPTRLTRLEGFDARLFAASEEAVAQALKSPLSASVLALWSLPEPRRTRVAETLRMGNWVQVIEKLEKDYVAFCAAAKIPPPEQEMDVVRLRKKVLAMHLAKERENVEGATAEQAAPVTPPCTALPVEQVTPPPWTALPAAQSTPVRSASTPPLQA